MANNTHKTLQQIKDEVAVSFGKDGFNELLYWCNNSPGTIDDAVDKIAEIWAKEKLINWIENESK